MSSSRQRRVGIVALLVSIVAAASVNLAKAEDEDTSASVYLVFDAETGEFVTQDDPHAALPNQTGLEDSGLTETETETVVEANVPAIQPSGGSMKMILGTTAVIVLCGAVFFAIRRQTT